MPEPVRKDITKQEAARRQIETAIRLFFADDDAVSVHVLASSAQVIIQDVCEVRGRPSMKDYVEMHVRPEYVGEWRRKAKEAYNYFKHADWDAEIALAHFDERFNDFILFATIIDYTTAFDVPPTTPMRLFIAWYIASNPNRVKPDFPGLAHILNAFDDLDKLPRDLQSSKGSSCWSLFPILIGSWRLQKRARQRRANWGLLCRPPARTRRWTNCVKRGDHIQGGDDEPRQGCAISHQGV